ncbi:MAG: OsmC family protein [Acidaminobacteraceae bacterium]
MTIQKNNIKFTNEFKGELITPRGNVKIGSGYGEVYPYDMLFGALASCLYATFLDVANKKHINYDSVDIEVTGEKRNETPTTLEWVNVKISIKNAEKEDGLVKSAELAAKYCSIYQTIALVADMNLEVEFI